MERGVGMFKRRQGRGSLGISRRDAIPAESFAAGRNVLDGFEMAYYLNPTPLDRNLEWDRKNNGFKGECPPYRLP